MIKLFFIKILTLLTLVIFPLVSFAFNESHLEKLKSLNECSQCDLVSVVLTKESFKNAILNNANLKKANLTDTYLTTFATDQAAAAMEPLWEEVST